MKLIVLLNFVLDSLAGLLTWLPAHRTSLLVLAVLGTSLPAVLLPAIKARALFLILTLAGATAVGFFSSKNSHSGT